MKQDGKPLITMFHNNSKLTLKHFFAFLAVHSVPCDTKKSVSQGTL